MVEREAAAVPVAQAVVERAAMEGRAAAVVGAAAVVAVALRHWGGLRPVAEDWEVVKPVVALAVAARGHCSPQGQVGEGIAAVAAAAAVAAVAGRRCLKEEAEDTAVGVTKLWNCLLAAAAAAAAKLSQSWRAAAVAKLSCWVRLPERQAGCGLW